MRDNSGLHRGVYAMRAILTVGPSACGKSTFCDDLVTKGWVKVERDEWRFKLFALKDGTRSWRTYKFTKAKEQAVTEACDKQIQEAAEQGKNIVISETNLNKKTRDKMVTKLEDLGYEVSFQEFDVSLDELWARDAQRFGGVGWKVIYKHYLKWLEYKGAWKYIPNEDLPRAICFDCDGTLSRMNGKRGPFDWAKVELDDPRQEIIDMLFGYQSQGYSIIIATGRDGCCERQTQNWLRSHGIVWDDFYIREAGDCRKDYIVKEEMLKEMEKKWNIVAWVDDRMSVGKHLRLLNVNIIDVGDPYYDF